MKQFNLQQLIEFDEVRFVPKVLVNQPGFRLVLLSLRAGQSVPEHSTSDRVAIYVVSGHITFYEAEDPAEVRAGEMLTIDGGTPHRLDAHEDSSVLVIRTGAATPANEELDLRHVPRSQRHPLVFLKFDALSIGESFVLVNDHDPVPLHMQMDQMRPDQLAWNYIDRGPDIFRIRVQRLAPLTGSEVSPESPSTMVTDIRRA